MSSSDVNYGYLIEKLDGFIRKFYLNKVIKGAIMMVASFLAAYILIILIEYLGNFEPGYRTFLFYSFIILNTFVFVTYIIIPLLSYYKLGKSINYEQASVIIGTHFGPIKDKLLNTLQLKKLTALNPEQRALIDAGIDQKVAELRPVPFSSAIRIEENRRYIKYALLPLSIIIVLFFAAPSILSESTNRILHHKEKFIKKAPFQFVILNKDLTALQGDDYTLQVKLNGDELPADVYLDDGQNSFKLQKDDILNFSYTFKNIQGDHKIRLRGGEFDSEIYLLEVRPRPTLLNFAVMLDYPAYLGKENETLENTGDLTIPIGTRINWQFRAKSADRLEVKFKNKFIRVNPSEAEIFKLSYRAMENLEYSVKPGNSKVHLKDSVSYRINVIPDLHPAISVTERPDSVNNKLFYFVGQINDDHGFSRLNFNYKILRTGEPDKFKTISKSIKIEKNTLQSNFFNIWNISELNMLPGDQIEYYFEVFDNDGVNGAKSSKSATKTFLVPSQREMEKEIDSNSEQIKDKMEQAIRNAASIEKEAKKINQELLNKKNLNYDEKKQVESLLDKQKELEELVKQIQKENKQNSFQKEENLELNEAILDKQKQIEELFNNVLDEKTRELLKNIEKLLEQNNKNQTQSELSKMQMDNKSLQKELDRILELYKQLEFDQKLNQTVAKLEDLAGKQAELAKQTLQQNSNNEKLNAEQKKLNSEFQDIKENLKELEEKNEALQQESNFENPQEEQEQIEQEQTKSLDNLQKQNKKQAAQNQKQAADKMQQLSQKLEEMQQEGEEQENEVNAKSLREILDNLLTSSFDQEKNMEALRGINTSDPNYVLQTQKQKEIKDNLKMVEDSLYSLSKKVPQIQSVVNKEIQAINHQLNQALESMSERKTPEANRNQQIALTSINNLALMLNEALEQLQDAMQNAKPGSKGKGKPSLSQLSKMQEQLNKNMQKAREQMQGEGQSQPGKQGKGSQGMSEQLAKMAREQQMIRQAMQELNRLENKDGQSKLGNLDQLVKEMEQTETDLVNKRIQQETIARQQEILGKLLDAEKADREREQDPKRESREGKVESPNYNIILQEYQKIKQAEIDLLKTVPPGLNSFYKIKVGDYFKNLNSDYK